VTLVRPAVDDSSQLEVVVATGAAERELVGLRYPIEDSTAWQAMQQGHGVRLDLLDRHPRYLSAPAGLRSGEPGDGSSTEKVKPVLAVPSWPAGLRRTHRSLTPTSTWLKLSRVRLPSPCSR
jgi:hypothetical protein